jgi:outer membrane protein OmpA-like peptidoglycan-associated protein
MKFGSNLRRIVILAEWLAAAVLVLGLTPATPAQETAPLESPTSDIEPDSESEAEPETEPEDSVPLETLPAYQITVNSPLDGPVTADGGLTLREAIELANGSLPLTALSPAEAALVQPLPLGDGSQIGFALPGADTEIDLLELLPPITAPNTVIDGTTQAGYGDQDGVYPDIPVPVVSLTPAAEAEVIRGLTLAADGVVVRGLSLYGFTSRWRATLTTPPADIFISNLPPPVDAGPGAPAVEDFAFAQPADAVQEVVLELNWLGLPPTEDMPEIRSAFGVSVFNAVGATIRQNRIQYHDGSGVITSVRAEAMALIDNVIVGNGLAGMPDAVRLEGQLTGATLEGNLICGNDGSGIYMFKPEGPTLIQNNNIRFNGRRFERAAVFVMGNEHHILDNQIGFQPGPGVAVAALPKSDRNLILNNQFAALDGLSIDLATHQNSDPRSLERADGPNPPRDSHNMRLETGNGAINAPEFPAYTLARTGPTTLVAGQADPGSEVTIYQVVEDDGIYSPLYVPLDTVTTNTDGVFTWEWGETDGIWISAIATDPEFGTSEPSPTIGIQGAGSNLPPLETQPPFQAVCEPPPPPPEPVVVAPPAPIQLEVPRQIHFALDQSTISPESAVVMDQIAAVMLANPSLVVELQGHTDPRASVAYNQALSERRSIAARDYMLQQGIAPERMRIVPLGESQRATTGSDRLDFARDRRVEFVFTDTRGLDIIFVDQETDLQPE